jgi:hypothetical protein
LGGGERKRGGGTRSERIYLNRKNDEIKNAKKKIDGVDTRMEKEVSDHSQLTIQN